MILERHDEIATTTLANVENRLTGTAATTVAIYTTGQHLNVPGGDQIIGHLGWIIDKLSENMTEGDLNNMELDRLINGAIENLIRFKIITMQERYNGGYRDMCINVLGELAQIIHEGSVK